MHGRGVRRAVAVAALVATLVVVLVLRAPLERAVLAVALDLATGYRVAFDAADIGLTEARFQEVRIAVGPVPLGGARRVALRYALRDLLPGSAHRYGLRAVEVDGLALVLRRRADGSFVGAGTGAPGGPLVGSPPAAPAARGLGATPFAFAVTVRDGRLTLDDPYRHLPSARRLEVARLALTARVDSAGTTLYRAAADLAGDRAQHVTLAGRIDRVRGFALHRLRARGLDATALADYFVNTAAARIERARARDVDVSAYAFAAPDGSLPYHLAGTATLADGAMRVPGLVPSATGMRGRFGAYDGGLAAGTLRGQLGALAVRFGGALYGWQRPAFRLGIEGAGDLAQVRQLFGFSRALPLAGSVRLATLLEGPAGLPLVATTVAAPHLRYGRYPLEALAGRAIYHDAALDVVGAHGRYGGLGIRVDGAVMLGSVARPALVARVTGPAAAVPYLAELAPDAAVDGVALLAGTGLRLDARGAVAGAGARTSLAGLFHVDPRGDGALGPVALREPGGARLAGAFYLRRSRSESGFWLDARDWPYARLPVAARLPGLGLVAPAFGGRLTGALAGDGPPSAFRLAGRVAARDVRIGAVRLAAVRGAVVGALGDYRLGAVAAEGAWGAFHGRGTYVGSRLALAGRYDGSFGDLRTFTGDLGAQGPLAGPVRLLIDPARTVVQTAGARGRGTTVRGIALGTVAGTLGVASGSLHVYGATAALGGGTAAAAGSLDARRSLALSLGAVAPGDLVRFPRLAPGRFSAIGRVGLAARRAVFDGAVAVSQADLDGWPATGDGTVTLSAGQLAIADGSGRVGSALGSFGGTIARPGTPAARYDLALRVGAAELGPLVRAVAPQRRDVAGTVGADLRVRGAGSSLAVAGRLAIPEGIVNGLAFRDLTTRLSLGTGRFAATDGALTVGSTRASFSGRFTGGEAAARIALPHADLADFNDFFDAGDTLGGRGRLAARFDARAGRVATSADIAITGLQYRRFALGDARAAWTSQGRDVRGRIAFGGTSGTLTTAGTLILADAPLAELVPRSRFAGTAHLRGLDLGVWLPAFGYHVPVEGRLDADATIAGRLADPDVRTTATLARGSIGAFPVDRFTVAATSTLQRTTIEAAELDLPSVALTASGTLGFGARDRLGLRVHAKSPNLAALAARLAGPAGQIGGRGEADVTVSGTRAAPRIAGGFDVEDASLRSVAVPQALGEFTLHGREVVLSAVEVRFATGTLELAGSVPFEIQPFGFGPPRAPLALEAGVSALDLGAFRGLLPAGSTLAGTLDGRVALEGTAGAPLLEGAMTLSNGAFASPSETVPLRGARGRLSFHGNSATLERFHALAGPGTLDLRGTATFPQLAHPGSAATYAFRATATRARLAFPAFGSGGLDGTLTLARGDAGPPLLGGGLTLSDATIPFSALLLAASAGNASGGDLGSSPVGPPALPALAFDFGVDAGRNVRVRSANVDIGARGSLQVGGSLAAPALDGTFVSTGGTLTYFNTIFRLLDGTVAFAPENGLVPTLDAHALTHVIDPDPNTVRNASGSADVTLALTGPVTGLTIGLSSQPAYDRQQILGLLLNAPALGASNLFGETPGSATLYGSNSTANLAPGVATTRNTSGELSVAQEAFGLANAQFTRALLAPIETSFASAVGLSNFNVNVDYTGSVGVQARKFLGKNVDAIFGTSFGYPYRQTFGFEIKPSATTAAQVTVFQTLGASGLNSLTPTTTLTGQSSRLEAVQPSAGTVGFSLGLEHLFP